MSSRKFVAVTATLALASTFAASLAQADVWRWKDAQNKWHYSDVPVEGAQLIKSTLRMPTPPGGPVESPPDAAPEGTPPVDRVAAYAAAATDRVAAESTARSVQQDISKKRAEQCKDATSRYEKQIAARRIFREGKNGERVFLNEAELAQTRLDARTDRDTACGSPTR